MSDLARPKRGPGRPSTRPIYYYFPGKTAILEAICREGITAFVERLGAIYAAALPSEEKVRRAIRAHLEPMLQQRFYVHAFLFQRRDLPKTARKPLDAQSHAYEALWRALIEEGQRTGAIAKSLDPHLTVLAILGMCNTVARWSRDAGEFGLDRVADEFARLVELGLFGKAKDKRPRLAVAG
jgi:AcrR family transcriptional regulator